MRLIAVVSARAVVATLLGFALWAAGPALLGWHVTTVVSDSMQPAIAAGDVVAARPAPSNALQVGQVLLVNDPDHPDRLRLHRYDAAADDGSIITRGDANSTADSSTVVVDDVLGVGALRVPLAGLPALWLLQQQWIPLLAFAAVALAALTLSVQSAVSRHAISPTQAVPADDDPSEAPPEPERAKRPLVPTRALTSMMVAVVLAGAAIVSPTTPLSTAHAAFAATTTQSAGFAAATATAPTQLRCTNNANGTITITWQHPGGGQGFTTITWQHPGGGQGFTTITWQHPGGGQGFTTITTGGVSTTLGPDARSTTISLQSLFSWSRQTVAIRSDLGG